MAEADEKAPPAPYGWEWCGPPPGFVLTHGAPTNLRWARSLTHGDFAAHLTPPPREPWQRPAFEWHSLNEAVEAGWLVQEGAHFGSQGGSNA